MCRREYFLRFFKKFDLRCYRSYFVITLKKIIQCLLVVFFTYIIVKLFSLICHGSIGNYTKEIIIGTTASIVATFVLSIFERCSEDYKTRIKIDKEIKSFLRLLGYNNEEDSSVCIDDSRNNIDVLYNMYEQICLDFGSLGYKGDTHYLSKYIYDVIKNINNNEDNFNLEESIKKLKEYDIYKL